MFASYEYKVITPLNWMTAEHCTVLCCVYVQFIQQGIRRDFNNVDEILNPPDGQDEGVWKYEHLRLHFAVIMRRELLTLLNLWLHDK